MRCELCGLDLLPGAQVCPRCHAAVGESEGIGAQAPSEPEAPPPVPVALLAPQVASGSVDPIAAATPPPPPTDKELAPRRSQGKKWITVVGVLLLVALVIVVPKLLTPNVESLKDKGDVAGLITALEYRNNPSIREAAAVALGDLGAQESLPALLVARGDTDPAVAVAAGTASLTLVKRLPDSEAVGALLAIQTDSSSAASGPAKSTLSTFLGGVGLPRTVAALLVLTGDSRTAVSAAAEAQLTATLAQQSDSVVVTTLTGMLRYAFPAVADGARAKLTAFLGEIGVDRAVQAVIAAKAGDTWLAVALKVPVEQLSVETWRRKIQLDDQATITSAGQAVTKGVPAPGAAGYTANGAFHPMVVIPGTQSFPWAGAPTAIRFLELAADVSEDTKTVEVCPYTATNGSGRATVTRYRQVVTVRVYRAKDAALLHTKSFTGGTPNRCQATIQTTPGAQLDLTGSYPGEADAWLASLVHVPQ